jgi:eukaryotic-like serine/threonine-protein kinase
MESLGRTPARVVGRYAVYDEIAAGGMATVHLGRLVGPIGFSRPVAIKRLQPQFARDPDFSAMFLDEARVAARVRHPNVVPVIDVVAEDGEILLVMEYVHGEAFSFLLRILAANRKRLPPRIVGNVLAAALQGLHAAHEATGEGGIPLGIVHRDVSPQNVLIGADGVARVLDFGVAKAAGQLHQTQTGQVKGKIRYMAPEQIRCAPVDRRADIWAASVMLWEALTGQRLFTGDTDAGALMQILEKPIPSPRRFAPDVSEALSRVALRGLERDPDDRFATALEMAAQIEAAVGLVSPREVGAWVKKVAHARLEERMKLLGEMDSDVLPDSMAPVHASLPHSGSFIVRTPSSGITVQRPRSRSLRVLGAISTVLGMAALGAFGARAIDGHANGSVAPSVVGASPLGPTSAQPPSATASAPAIASASATTSAAPSAPASAEAPPPPEPTASARPSWQQTPPKWRSSWRPRPKESAPAGAAPSAKAGAGSGARPDSPPRARPDPMDPL